MSTRIDEWLRDEIVKFGTAQREGPSEALRRVAREWWAMRELPAIEFRESTTGRRAGLRSGPDVWEVVMVWRGYGPDAREDFYGHWAKHIPREHLDQALRYYERFPEEIDDHLAMNDRIAAQLEARGMG